MPLKYIKSRNGTNILVHQNYLYYRHTVIREDKVSWRCILYGPSCRGRIKVEGDKIVKIVDHSHLPDEDEVKLREAMGKKRFADGQARPSGNKSRTSKKLVNNNDVIKQ